MIDLRGQLLVSASCMSLVVGSGTAFAQTAPVPAPRIGQAARPAKPAVTPPAAPPTLPTPRTPSSSDQTSQPAQSTAGALQTRDGATPPEVEGEGGDIVVTGFRSSLQKAIDLKREAIGVRDSIVAEDIGKFPEQNVAESLQRIPGVILQRDGPSNEGQKISLRGLGSNYVVTTINGAPVRVTTSADIGSSARNFNYDVFPSELFGRVDVYKTPLANLEEGGISGNVDLQTPRPFDTPGRVIRYAINGQYNTTSKKFNPRGMALISQTSGDFGALLGVAYAKNVNLRSGFQTTGAAYNTSRLGRLGYQTPVPRGTRIGPYRFELDYASPRTDLGELTRDEVDNAYMPRFFRAYGGSNTRERIGGVASIQYKTDRLDISLDGIYADITDARDEYTFGVPVRETRTTNRNAPPGRTGNSGLIPIDVQIDDFNNLYGTFGNTNLFNESFYYDANTRFYYGIARASWKAFDNFNVYAQANYNRSRAEYFQNRILTNIYGIDATFDPTVNRDFPSITTPVNYNSPDPYRASGMRDPGLLLQNDIETDTQKNARLLFDYDPDPLGDVKLHARFGGSYISTDKATRRKKIDTLFANVFPGETDVFRHMVPDLPIGTIPNGGNDDFPSSWAVFPRAYSVDTLDSMALTASGVPDPTANFTAQENVLSLFMEVDTTTEIGGHELRTNVGMRYSDTRTHINNVRLQEGTLVPNEADGGYRYWLPSMSVAFDLTEKVVLRGSMGKTITRAALTNIARATNIPTSTAASAVSGNPSLRPQVATGFDAGAEWYFATGGLLAIGGFRKVLRDTTISQTVTVPFGSLGLPASSLNKAVFYPDTDAPDPNLPINLTTFFNGGEVQVLNGLEIAYQQTFTFLPQPFDGLGILSSFTRIFPRELTYPALDGTIVPVNTVPKISYSVTGYYEKGPFAVRASWNYRDRTSGSTVNDGTNLINWSAARGYLDATASYKFSDALELRADVLNLTNTRAWNYYEDPTGADGNGASRPYDSFFNGRTISIGIRGRF